MKIALMARFAAAETIPWNQRAGQVFDTCAYLFLSKMGVCDEEFGGIATPSVEPTAKSPTHKFAAH